jgi:hypothetical protein
MVAVVAENSLTLGGGVETPLAELEVDDGVKIGQMLASMLAGTRLGPRQAVDRWIKRHPALVELDRQEEWFRPMFEAMAKKLMSTVGWAAKRRLMVGALLTWVDLITDMQMIEEYVGERSERQKRCLTTVFFWGGGGREVRRVGGASERANNLFSCASVGREEAPSEQPLLLRARRAGGGSERANYLFSCASGGRPSERAKTSSLARAAGGSSLRVRANNIFPCARPQQPLLLREQWAGARFACARTASSLAIAPNNIFSCASSGRELASRAREQPLPLRSPPSNLFSCASGTGQELASLVREQPLLWRSPPTTFSLARASLARPISFVLASP